MKKKIKQISITEALELSKLGQKVYALTPNKPTVKSFNNLSVGDVMKNESEYIFVLFEEA